MKYSGQSLTDVGALSKILSVKPALLGYLSLNMEKNVRIKEEPKKSNPSEVRVIGQPSKALKVIQRKIKDEILTHYAYEPFVFGLGGNTLKDHGTQHLGAREVVKLDLRDFYPSISYDLVYEMWVEKFAFSHDVARLLTKLTTMNGGLMQGFPTSSHIAGIAAENFTTAINQHCVRQGLKFSQYVDDLNISGLDINYRALFKEIIPLGRASGLSIKKRKTKVNAAKVGKTITGTSVFNQRIRATKNVRQKAIRALKALLDNPNDDRQPGRVSGYKGFLRHLNKKDGKKYESLTNKAPESQP